ncbi:MAG: hypothetical protein GXX83_07150 [Gaiellales bacterium]|nr:hypothetical protein [Gaiellales bacterium]
MEFQRKDYLVRIFQEVGEVLAELAGLRQTRRHERALELLNRAVAGILGLNPELAALLAADSLLTLVDMDPLLDNNHRLLLAELLEAKAEVQDEMQDGCGAASSRELATEVRAQVVG